MNGLSGYNELALRALNGIANTVQAGLEEAPKYVVDLVGRYGMYLGWSGVIGGVLCLLLSIFGAYMIKRGYETRDRWDEPAVGQIIIGVVALIFGLISLLCCIDGALKGFLIPEVSLVEKFTNHRCY